MTEDITIHLRDIKNSLDNEYINEQENEKIDTECINQIFSKLTESYVYTKSTLSKHSKNMKYVDLSESESISNNDQSSQDVNNIPFDITTFK